MFQGNVLRAPHLFGNGTFQGVDADGHQPCSYRFSSHRQRHSIGNLLHCFQPSDLLGWTAGRALIATGSPFPAVSHNRRLIEIGHCNNAFTFPGVGLGVIASGSRRVTDGQVLKVSLCLPMSGCTLGNAFALSSLVAVSESGDVLRASTALPSLNAGWKFGAPGAIPTRDLSLRRRALYAAELREHRRES